MAFKGATLKKLGYEVSRGKSLLLTFFGIKPSPFAQSYQAGIKDSAVSPQHPFIAWQTLCLLNTENISSGSTPSMKTPTVAEN
jgi:hypothetical protein